MRVVEAFIAIVILLQVTYVMYRLFIKMDL
jgi:hypothetical protein